MGFRCGPIETIEVLRHRVIEQLRSGLELPRDAITKGYNLPDYFGLPIRSEAQVYDIHQIRPDAPTEVFVTAATRPKLTISYPAPGRWLTQGKIGHRASYSFKEEIA